MDKKCYFFKIDSSKQVWLLTMLTHIFTTDFRDGVTSSEATDLKTVNASGNGIQTGGGSGTYHK